MRSDTSEFWLPETLREHKERLGSWSALETGIEKANQAFDPSRTGTKVDRRKLERLCNGANNVSFSIRELRSLDIFLCKYNQGLSQRPLFDSRNVLDSIAFLSSEVNFYIGVRPGRTETDPEGKIMQRDMLGTVSPWDLRAIAILQRTSLSKVPDQIWDIADRSEWKKFDDHRGARIAIGSGLANFGSDCLLKEMFLLDESDRSQSPLCMVAPNQSINNTFVRNSFEDITNRCFVVGGYRCDPDNSREETGLVIYKRTGRSILLVLEGLRARGTYAAAKALHDGLIDDPKNPVHNQSSVFVFTIRASLDKDRTSRDANIVDISVSELFRFDRKEDKWHVSRWPKPQ